MESQRNNKYNIVNISLVSAEDLQLSKNNMVYVVLCLTTNPKQKLLSRVVRAEDGNPTWNNDKFITEIGTDVMSTGSDACLVFEFYAVRKYRKDKKVGEVNVWLENLLVKEQKEGREEEGSGSTTKRSRKGCYVVRNRCGVPKGFLNIVVEIFSIEALPVFFGSNNSLVDHRKFMGCSLRTRKKNYKDRLY